MKLNVGLYGKDLRESDARKRAVIRKDAARVLAAVAACRGADDSFCMPALTADWDAVADMIEALAETL